METFPDYLETYKSLPWLIDRWREYSGEIVSDKDPDEASRLQARMDKLVEEQGFGCFEEITPECAASLTEEEQDIFAEYCYLSVQQMLERYMENITGRLFLYWPDEEKKTCTILFDSESNSDDGYGPGKDLPCLLSRG